MRCEQQTSLDGRELGNENIVIIKIPTSELFECYSVTDFNNLLQGGYRNNIFYSGRKIIYKLIYSNIYVNGDKLKEFFDNGERLFQISLVPEEIFINGIGIKPVHDVELNDEHLNYEHHQFDDVHHSDDIPHHNSEDFFYVEHLAPREQKMPEQKIPPVEHEDRLEQGDSDDEPFEFEEFLNENPERREYIPTPPPLTPPPPSERRSERTQNMSEREYQNYLDRERERSRIWRENLSPSGRERLRLRHRVYRLNKKSEMTEEQKLEKKKHDAERRKQWIASMTPERREEYLKTRRANVKKQKQVELSEEEAQRRRQHNIERQRNYFANMTPERREEYLRTQRELAKKRYQQKRDEKRNKKDEE